MSGLNPFRHRQFKDTARQSISSVKYSDVAFSPGSSSSSPSHRVPDAPPHERPPSDADDSRSSDEGQAGHDPFQPDPNLSDSNSDEETGEDSDSPALNNGCLLSANFDPPRAPSPISAIGITTPAATAEKDEAVVKQTVVHNDGLLSGGNTSLGGGKTDGPGQADADHPPVASVSIRRRSEAENLCSDDVEPKALATHPVTKEKKPPPPPRSHHGKRISISSDMMISGRPLPPPSNPSSPPSMTSSTPPRAHRLSQPTLSYSSVRATNEPPATDTITRSRSQHKRPPTPPLARRRSQLVRSKSTASRNEPSPLGLRQDNLESGFPSSSPSSSSSSSTESKSTPGLRHLEPLEGAPRLDHLSRRVAPGKENIAQPTFTLTDDSPDPASLQDLRRASLKASRRISYVNGLTLSSSNQPLPPPPPPPPRRLRALSKGSTDSKRPPVDATENARDMDEGVSFRPSNASDILADLSRLQKEVDDLRGHYENRKDSQ
ncbi:hypothetical protein ASPZODRAFT_136242 [Penicilliopsis zonata CBS 506.65]|uniref:Uncharacterized protein n=1 Tax=Penicilliopsis zonata CBS 506.65 TaxID=1073090 RepID=A0A1L9S8A5_9EURO|nr:hypothetical protein ASPZODRAFT_136242 [Penicilliopsis zonata CBS 506.65]OJJ43391.1 hypothetical protein ASPZODRAFT_136242 [Penicilliopsis zonata CBS 506.65]